MPTQFKFYNIIPAPVMQSDINGDAKCLFGVLSGIADTNGEVDVKNDELADYFKVPVITIQRWLKTLQAKGFIDVTIKGSRRKIYLNYHIKNDTLNQEYHIKNDTLNKKQGIKNDMVQGIKNDTLNNYHIKNDTLNKTQVIDNEDENNYHIKNDTLNVLQTTTTDYIKTNNISRSSRTKKENSAPPQFLFSETKYVTEPKGVELFENDILAKSKDYDVADLKYYYNRALSWSNEKQARKYDWITTVITWMQIDNQKGKLILKSKTQFNNDTGITDASGYKLTRNRAKAIQRLIEEGELDR